MQVLVFSCHLSLAFYEFYASHSNQFLPSSMFFTITQPAKLV